MNKKIIMLLSFTMVTIMLLVSCAQPAGIASSPSQADTAQIVEENDVNSPETVDSSESRLEYRKYITATDYYRITPGSGPATGQSWYRVRGKDGSRYYMRAEDTDGNATPHVVIVDDYKRYSPKVSYRVYLNRNKFYYIWINGYGTSGKENSVYVGMDRTIDVDYLAPGYYVHSLWDNGRWTWSNELNGGYPAKLRVRKDGYYYINVWMRENGFRFKELFITDNSVTRP